MPSLETSLQDPSHISTINGFRLGRLPGVSVDWAELNTAWGLAVLLLRALVTRVQLQLRGYELVPYGDQSYIKLLDDGKVLPLYWHGSGMLELQTNYRRSFQNHGEEKAPASAFITSKTQLTIKTLW